jgi:hypothetical protein
MPFVGGEEEAHDHWHDKWSTRRRTSMEEHSRESDAMAFVFGQAYVTRPIARSAYPVARPVPGKDTKTLPSGPLMREDIYEGNFWG